MHRAAAALYCLALTGVTAIGYVPAFADADGRLFGVFRLTWTNDALHLASAAWALGAALAGPRASVVFLRLFGALYLADGLLGLATGSGYLDLGIVIAGIRDLPLGFRIAANLPHVTLGTLALLAGLWPARRGGSRA